MDTRALMSLFTGALAVGTPGAQTDDPVAKGAVAASVTADDAELVRRIDAYLEPILADRHLSGTVLVAKGEDVLFERAYGMADHEHSVANTVDTRHCVASITKPMTLIIALRLFAERKLGLRDTVDKWIEGFPNGDRITVEHLARHRAGIRHRVTTEIEETVPRTAADMVELAKQSELLGEPGPRSVYSSAGYSVFAYVLERAGGKPFADLLQEHVCDPAGLTRTVHTDGRTVLEGRARSYMPGATGLRNAPLKDMSFLVGAGSVYSTARDLFRLLTVVRKGLLGRSVRASLRDDDGGITWNGASNGFRAFADYHAASDVSVVVTANLTTGAIDRMRRALPRIAAGETVEPPERVSITPVEMSPDTIAEFTGRFEMRPGSELSARVEAGDFLVGSYVLIPIGGDRFFSVQDYAEVNAERDDDGRVVTLRWGDLPMRRVDEGGR